MRCRNRAKEKLIVDLLKVHIKTAQKSLHFIQTPGKVKHVRNLIRWQHLTSAIEGVLRKSSPTENEVEMKKQIKVRSEYLCNGGFADDIVRYYILRPLEDMKIKY